MSWKNRVVDRSRGWVQRPALMRVVSSDRVMRAAEGVLDAKARVRLALAVLRSGRSLPPIDPALDDSLGETVQADAESGQANPSTGRSRSAASSGTTLSPNGNSLPPVLPHGNRVPVARAVAAGGGTGALATNPAEGARGRDSAGAGNGHASNGHASNGHASNGHGATPALQGVPVPAARLRPGRPISNGARTPGANGGPRPAGDSVPGSAVDARGLVINAASLNARSGAVALLPPAAARSAGAVLPSAAEDPGMADQLRSRSQLSAVGGSDVFAKCHQFTTADNARKAGMYPYFRPLDLNDGPEAVVDGRRVLMLGSNNYLGLTTHPEVRAAAKTAIDRFGTSMTGSRLVNGSMKLHDELEQRLASYFGKEAALVFTTGYQANLATCAALLSNRNTVAVIDRNVHASLYDGVRLGQAVGARMVRYRHSDPRALDRALSRLAVGEGALVMTDGVFSAEGEIAKLDEIVPIVKKHGARLLVDDAHALGVIGPGGRGSAHHFGVEQDVDLITGTFSKSMASVGGWIVGERKVLDYIKHFAPSFMFAASAAPPNVAAATAAFDVMQKEPERMLRLRDNFTFMRDELTRLGFELGHTQTAVIPIYIRQDLRTLMMWKDLLENHGVYTNPFISPGVPPKSAMLRTSYMATHSREQLERGLEALEKVGKKYGVIS